MVLLVLVMENDLIWLEYWELWRCIYAWSKLTIQGVRKTIV